MKKEYNVGDVREKTGKLMVSVPIRYGDPYEYLKSIGYDMEVFTGTNWVPLLD